jgi:hypothetical protein
MVEMMPARPIRRMISAVATAVVLTLSVAACTGDGGDARSTAAPVSARPAERPSQSAADAKRDAIVPQVAALPYAARVDALSTVRIDDERWAISRIPMRSLARVGCEGPQDADYGVDYVCGSEYGELLQLDGKKIVRAYAMPGIPPEHIAITEDAVYCARQGDGALSDSTVCRVDRRTHELTLRVFPAADTKAWVDDAEQVPDGWTLDTEALEVNKFAVDDAGVWAKAYKGAWTKLDPNTLEIVERDIERVTTDL